MIPTQRIRHDLRTPVNHLLGYSQLLIEDAQESGVDDGIALFERIAALGKDVLRQIELSLPSTETTAPEQRLIELRGLLAPRVTEINQTLDSLSFDKSSSQFADVQRLHQATDKLSRFVQTGSLDAPVATAPAAVPTETLAAADHLLVVDDDAANRDVLARMLQKLKYRVSVASSGAEAIELASHQSYDLMLLDILMPGINGYEVLKHLKSSKPDLPIIVISALNEMESVTRCVSMGAEDYFQKPFEAILLRARISSALERQRYRHQLMDQESLVSLREATAEVAHEIKNALDCVINSARTAADAAGELWLAHNAAPATNQLLTALAGDLRNIKEHGSRANEIVNGILLRHAEKVGESAGSLVPENVGNLLSYTTRLP
jgi:CheY-like chemotaxis protein